MEKGQHIKLSFQTSESVIMCLILFSDQVRNNIFYMVKNNTPSFNV